MSKTGEINYRRSERNFERHITVRSVDRDPPDLRKLSRAVIAIALRDAEAQAEALSALKGSVDATVETPSATNQSDNPEQPNA